MELKHRGDRQCNHCDSVLIVPYGIETEFTINLRELGSVLIVPYGIET